MKARLPKGYSNGGGANNMQQLARQAHKIQEAMEEATTELEWNAWKNKRNIYNSFNDNNKSMSIAGLYEYTFRNFYITYINHYQFYLLYSLSL